jgi:protein O-mannosyl-transferase
MKQLLSQTAQFSLLKRPLVLVCFLLVISTSFAYWNVDQCGFIDFDDSDYVYRNYHIFSGFTSASLHWAFTSFQAANWHPLTWLSLMLDYQFYGLKPAGYHLTNVVFHVLNTLLLLFALRAMTGTVWRSALVAALFGLHPLHVESVAWVSERKDVLCAFFMFITLLFYTSFARRKHWGHYFAALFFFAVGLLAKPMIVTLPFVLLLLDIWPLGRLKLAGNEKQPSNTVSRKNRTIFIFLEKMPFIILSIASCGVTILAQRAGSAIVEIKELPIVVRLANSVLSYVEYIEKMFWPKKLSFFYPLPINMPSTKSIVIALALLLLISVVVVIRTKKQPYLLVGWLWFLGTLIPVIGLVQVGGQALADRYTYIPLIGLFICIAWLLGEVTRRYGYLKIIAITGSFVVLFIAMFQTRTQAGYWKNDLTLSDHAIAISKSNFLAYSTKGHYLLSSGNNNEALTCFAKSLSLCPIQDVPKINIGCILFNQGKVKESFALFKEVLAKDSNDKLVLVDCGISYAKLGDTKSALAYFSRALTIDSCFYLALYNLGKLYGAEKDYQKSIRYLLQASRVNPNDPGMFLALGNSCFLSNKREDAIKWYEKSVSLNPYFIPARHQLAMALDSCGRHDLAKKQIVIADSLVALWEATVKNSNKKAPPY